MTRSTDAGSSASRSLSNSFCTRSPESFASPAFSGCRRMQRAGVDLALAVPGMKTEQPQDAQIVLADARRRIPDETNASRLQIRDAADEIDHFAVSGRVERVHREVATCCVFVPVGGERDDGAASVGGDIAAQCRDLERRAVGDRGHRAVLDAGRHCAETGSLQALYHLVRRQRRCDVDVRHFALEKRVAHRAADEARVGPERRHHRARLRRRHPSLAFGIEFHRGFSAG